MFEDWLQGYFSGEECWECAIDGEDLNAAFNAGFQAGIDYIRQGGSFKLGVVWAGGRQRGTRHWKGISTSASAVCVPVMRYITGS